jgi:hypothetical protein
MFDPSGIYLVLSSEGGRQFLFFQMAGQLFQSSSAEKPFVRI